MIWARAPVPDSDNSDNIAHILTWRRKSAAPPSWMPGYDDLLIDCLKGLSASSEENRAFVEATDLLSPQHRSRFLRSPIVAQQLLSFRDGRHVDESVMAKALLATLAESGMASALPEPVWTARGDRCLFPDAMSDWGFASDGVGGTGAVIDFESPIPHDSDIPHRLFSLNRGEQVLATEKVVLALGVLNETSHDIWQFWSSLVDVIAIRKTQYAMPGLASSTTARQPRGLTLINAQDEQVTIALLADGLLHEAIHSLLFIFEHTVKQFLIDQKQGRNVFVFSPWSGRDLQLISYIHACFVWYGLYWYWTLCIERGGTSADRAKIECDRVLAGFRKRPVSKGLTDHLNLLSGEVVRLLEEVEARICSNS